MLRAAEEERVVKVAVGHEARRAHALHHLLRLLRVAALEAGLVTVRVRVRVRARVRVRERVRVRVS